MAIYFLFLLIKDKLQNFGDLNINYYFFPDLLLVITLGDSRKNIAKKIIPRVPTNKKV